MEGLTSCAANLLPAGAILLCSRATIGETRIAALPVCTNQGFKSLVCKEGICNEFLYYLVVTLKPQLIKRATGSTFLEISKRDVASIEVVLPSSDEQRAIAEALSDMDCLLEMLDTLIAKKLAIKRAAMQQLLTGNIRLPGFSGEWVTVRIGDLLSYERPDRYIVRSADYSERGTVPVLTANKSFVLGYTDEDSDVFNGFPAIVFDDFTTASKYATFPFKVRSSAIKLLRAKHDRVSLRYVFERMQLVRFPVGDHKRYYISEYEHIKLPVPDYEEQVEIVSALADMDAEIAALELRQQKTRAIKRGMMQQLLTGRVRLVNQETMAKEVAS